MKSATTEYWVYENYPSDKAVGHVNTCNYFKVEDGNATATGKWHGDISARLRSGPFPLITDVVES
jgi:hypothetical protein